MKRQNNQEFSTSIIKYLVDAVQKERMAELMSFLSQDVILYLIGEYTPQEIGSEWKSERYPKAVITGINILEGRYLIEYEDTSTRYFPTLEAAQTFSENGRYDYDKSSCREDSNYPYKGAWTHRCNTEVSWD